MVSLLKDSQDQKIAGLYARVAREGREESLRTNYALFKLLGGGTIDYRKPRVRILAEPHRGQLGTIVGGTAWYNTQPDPGDRLIAVDGVSERYYYEAWMFEVVPSDKPAPGEIAATLGEFVRENER